MESGTAYYISSRFKNMRRLSKEKTCELIKRYKNGDMKAGQKVVEHNTKYMISFTSYYIQKYNIEFDDLFTLGIFALYKAINGFDVNREVAFSTYARFWIRHEFNRFLLFRPLVRISEFEMKKGNYERLSFIPINKKKDIDFCEGDTECYVIKSYPKHRDHILSESIMQELNTLDERERDIIKLFFGFEDKEYTLSEIGKKHHVSRERIRQIKEIVIKKLKCNKEMNKIMRELM